MKFSEPLQFKFAPAESTEAQAEIGYFTAYASTRNKDRHGDIVAPGAFADSIKAMESGQRNVPLLWMHDHKQPLGTILTAAEDDNGLFVSGQLVKGTATADRAYALLKKGALSLSIGYLPAESEPLAGRGALLKRVDLHEISLVAVPSNAQSTVLSVRSLPEFTRPEWEKMLSNGCLPPVSSRLSGILAKACMSAIGAGDEPSDDEPETISYAEIDAYAERQVKGAVSALKSEHAREIANLNGIIVAYEKFLNAKPDQAAEQQRLADAAELASAIDRLHQIYKH